MTPVFGRLRGFMFTFGLVTAIVAGLGAFLIWLKTDDEHKARCYLIKHGPYIYRDRDPTCK